MSISKSYSGIIGEQQKGVERLIKTERAKGSSYAAIAKLIKSEFGLKVSHTTVCSYWKDKLEGERMDEHREQTAKEIYKEDEQQFVAPIIDQSKLDEISEQHKKRNTLGSVEHQRDIAQLMVHSNQIAHLQGKEVLRPQYTKQLRDLEAILKSRKG